MTAALYVPKRAYFFGGWPAQSDLLDGLRAHGLSVTSTWLPSHKATGVTATRPITPAELATWAALDVEHLKIPREVYVGFLIEDITQVRGAVAQDYIRAATYSLDHWAPVEGYADLLRQEAALATI